jgi:hypothetical protein
MGRYKTTLLNSICVSINNVEKDKLQKVQNENQSHQYKPKIQMEQLLYNRPRIKKTINSIVRGVKGAEKRGSEWIESLTKERSSSNVDRYRLRISEYEFKILNKNGEDIEEGEKALV